ELFAVGPFAVTVLQPDQPLQITSTPVLSATVGQLYSYDVDATDRNPGAILTFSLPTAPAGMTITPPTGLIQWTPTATHVRRHATVRVQDQGGLTATQSFSIAVPQPNRPPVITSAPLTNATAGVPYSYDVDAIDPDVGDTLTFALTLAPTGMTMNATTGFIQW